MFFIKPLFFMESCKNIRIILPIDCNCSNVEQFF